MENIQNLVLIILNILFALYLIYKVLDLKKKNKDLEVDLSYNEMIVDKLENAIYGITREDKKEMNLDILMTIKDADKHRILSEEYEGIKPEYEEFLKKAKIQQALRNDFRNSDYTKSFIRENMPNEMIAIELLKILKNKDKVINVNTIRIKDLENGTEIKKLNKRLHVKDQTIYRLRKKYGEEAPRRKNKTGQNNKK